MRDSTRLIATSIIWIAFTIMLGVMASAVTMMDASMDETAGAIIFAIILTLAVAVTKSTNAIWQAPAQDDYERIPGKTKRRRSNRMERLIAALDDDDIYDLETLLLARDDELRTTHHI